MKDIGSAREQPSESPDSPGPRRCPYRRRRRPAAGRRAPRGAELVAEDIRGIGESMEHEMAMRQMRAHPARAGREIQSAGS